MTWKVTQRNVWKEIANLRIKRINNYTKSQHHAWMTINSKKRKNESVGELSTKEGKALYFAAILDVGHLKNSEFEPQFQKIKVEFYSEVTL